MSCEFCHDHEEAIFEDDKTIVYITGQELRNHKQVFTGALNGNTESIKIDYQINFCPMCGEPLTEPRALTLEEFLKHMEDNNNHPLWMALLEPHQGQWYTVEEIVEEFGYAVRTEGGTNVDFEEYLKEAYGVSFCVYHHKPKEG